MVLLSCAQKYLGWWGFHNRTFVLIAIQVRCITVDNAIVKNIIMNIDRSESLIVAKILLAPRKIITTL